MKSERLPRVPFGPYQISRLILGDNPINGGSHLSRFVNAQMRRYFTPERILELLAACEREGVNLWQSNPPSLELYAQHRRSGGQMQFISLGHDRDGDTAHITQLAEAGAIGIAHHGEVTDMLFKQGEVDRIKGYLQKVRDAGLLAGVSTHMPAVVDYIDSRGWDVDFFMTCVYERHRSKDELKAMLGYVPLPQGEVYLEEDPPRMFVAMRRTATPCLAFKILAAGRLSDCEAWVEEAFRETFRQIKPTDAVIVGMYPEYEDQPAQNAGWVREFSGLSGGELAENAGKGDDCLSSAETI